MQVKKETIVFVIHSLRGGGAERVAETLLETMQHFPDLALTLVLFTKGAESSFGPNVRVEYIDVEEKETFFYVVFKFIKIVISLTRIVKRESPCTIFSLMEYSNIISILCNWIAGKKNRVIISVHSPLSRQIVKYPPGYRERVVGILARMLYNQTDAIVAVSRNIRRDLIENFNIDNRLVNVIDNPIDLRRIALLSDEEVGEELFRGKRPIILSVGRLSREKGHDVLLRAFSLLRMNTEAVLVIIGEGREEENLRKLSKHLEIDKEVHFLGHKKNPYKYMKRATLFVHTSHYEGFGIVLVEAMTCGLPVIATRSYEGIEDIIENGENGLLVPIADEEGLAKAMESLLQDEPLRNALAQEAALRVKNYSVDVIVSEYKKVLLPAHAATR